MVEILVRPGATVAARLMPIDDAVMASYRDFCAGRVVAPAQHPLWVAAWMGATGADAVMLEVGDGDSQLRIPMEVVRQGPFRIARYMGGNHANGSFPAVMPGHAPVLAAEDVAAIRGALRAARPDIDLLALTRHNPEQDGLDNPLRGLETGRSPNVSLAVDLSQGFEGLLDRRHGKRKRKKFRLQERKLDELGEPRLLQPATPAEVDRVLDAFFRLKAARFAKAGIPDVFAPSEVQAFFRALFTTALDDPERPFRLDAVEAGGTLRAVNGQSVTATRVICEFGAICDDMPNASPGFFLDFTNIRQAACEGKAVYDFSVGDEDYKRSWCEIETWQFDCFWPVSGKGHTLDALMRARAAAVRLVKSNAQVWSLAKRARAHLAGETAARKADD